MSAYYKSYDSDTYPGNLIYRMIGYDITLPHDTELTIEYILLRFLSEQERRCIHMRYRDKLKLKEIADSEGLSESGVSNIISRAVAVLSKDAFSILVGGYTSSVEEARRRSIDSYTDIIQAVQEQTIDPQKLSRLLHGRHKITIDSPELDLGLDDISLSRLKDINVTTLDDLIRTPCDVLIGSYLNSRVYINIVNKLSDAGLDIIGHKRYLKGTWLKYCIPTRAYNALAAASVLTLYDLLKLERWDLMDIDGIGSESYREIAEYLSRKGLDISHYSILVDKDWFDYCKYSDK